MRGDGGVEAGVGPPGAVAHGGDELADLAGRMERHGTAIAGEDVAVVDQALDAQFNPLDRGIDKTHGAGSRAFFAHHVPGFEREAHFGMHVLGAEVAQMREAEFKMRCEPFRLDRITGQVHLLDHVAQIGPDEIGQHEAVVQFSTPALQARWLIRRLPEPCDQGAHQQLLGQAHARMRRHLKGAHFEQAQAAGRTIGRVELVDAELGAMGVARHVNQQVTQDPVDHPRRRRHCIGAAF